MSIDGKHNSIVIVAVAAAALALGAISTAADAQDSTGPHASQPGSDADLAARVTNALQSDPNLDARHIDVAVDHGAVHLKGFVQSSRALLAAGDIATKAAGHRKIYNELIIKQGFANAP